MTTTEATEKVETDDARRLVALYDERIRLTREAAQTEHLTGADVQAILAAGDALDDACEVFRRRYYPRRHRVIVGLRTVMAASETGRSVTTVYDAGLPA